MSESLSSVSNAPSVSSPRVTTPYRVFLVLMVLILLGAGIRLVQLEEKSLWQDEIFTLASATGNNIFEATIRPDDADTASDVSTGDSATLKPSAEYRGEVTEVQPMASFWHALRRNIQTPLYPLLMRWCVQTFGPDPVGLRYFSVLMGTLAIAAAFGLGRQVKDSRFGLLLAALVCFSGFQITYSQTARVYALVTLLVLLSTWMVVKLLQERGKNPWTWGAFALFSVLGLYSQYLYNFVLLFQAVFALVAGRQSLGTEFKPFVMRMLLTAGVVGGCYLPWLPMLQAQQAFLAEVGHGNLKGLWNPLSLIERLWNVLTDLMTPKFLVAKIYATLIILFGAVMAWRHRARPDQATTRLLYLLGGLWLLCLVGGLMGIDLANGTHRILSKRYTILASPALYLLLAAGLLALPKRVFKPATAALLGLMIWNSVEVVSGSKFVAKENYRKAARLIQDTPASSKDLVLVSHSGVHATGMAFYLPGKTEVLGISRKNPGNPWDPSELSKVLAKSAQPYQRVWVVFTHSPKPLRLQIKGWFDHHYHEARHEKYSGVDVFLYKK